MNETKLNSLNFARIFKSFITYQPMKTQKIKTNKLQKDVG